jgi:hypothetical protein
MKASNGVRPTTQKADASRTVSKSHRRVAAKGSIWWRQDICAENKVHVAIGREDYLLSADGLLMPTENDQPPPNLRSSQPGAEMTTASWSARAV